MKNTLADLNNYLFEQLERINDDALSPEALEKEITRSRAVSDVAKSIVENASLQFKVIQHMDEYGYNLEAKKQKAMPAMLSGGTE